MALDIPALIRKGIAQVKSTMSSMPVTVQHYPRNQRTPSGVTYGPPVERQAIMEESAQGVPTAAGTMAVATVKLTFLEPVVVLDRDKFTLPDGRTLNELRHAGPSDPDGVPYMTQVWLS